MEVKKKQGSFPFAPDATRDWVVVHRPVPRPKGGAPRVLERRLTEAEALARAGELAAKIAGVVAAVRRPRPVGEYVCPTCHKTRTAAPTPKHCGRSMVAVAPLRKRRVA